MLNAAPCWPRAFLHIKPQVMAGTWSTAPLLVSGEDLWYGAFLLYSDYCRASVRWLLGSSCHIPSSFDVTSTPSDVPSLDFGKDFHSSESQILGLNAASVKSQA